MPYIQGTDRNQRTLLPDTLDDYVSEDNPTRVIDVFVNTLVPASLGFKYEAAETGRPGYDPRDMLKLYIYGYQNGLRSSRKLMRESGRNVELMWLLGKIAPDFRCIADFRKDNAAALKKVFLAFVQCCNEAGLLSKDFVAIDGSKFKANNSRDRNFNRKTLAKKLEETKQRIDDYIKELDDNDADENGRHSPDELRRRIKRLEVKKSEYAQILKNLEQSGEHQVSVTDPESKLMKTRHGFDVCYNVQTAVEAKNHFIVNFDATSDANDMRQLESAVNGAKEALGVDNIEAAADKGYRSDSEVMACLLNGDTPNVYCHDKKDCYKFEFKHTETEITAEMKASKDPETVMTCIEAGVMPDILHDKNVTLEVVKPEMLPEGQVTFERQPPLFADFERDLQTNKVRCPMGQTLSRWGFTSNKARNSKYGNAKACAVCANKCTAGKFRCIAFKPGVTSIRATFYDRCLSGKPVLRFQLPRAVTTKTPEKPTVILRFYPDYNKLALRSQTVEHPFGTVKHWNGSSFLLLNGKHKVNAELSLAFLGYNMKRAIKLLGASVLAEMLNKSKVVMG